MIIPTRTEIMRKALPVWIVLVATIVLTGRAMAQGAAVFAVEAVAVDVTAETSAAARERAIVEAQREAYDRLIDRLVLEEDRALLPEIPAGEIDQLVQNMSIANERTSAVRYLAELSFRFRPEPIRTLLNNAAVRYTEAVSAPVLVVPLWQDGQTVRLWEEPNPWRSAWEANAPNYVLTPFAVPLGDIMDVSELSVAAALRGGARPLQRMADRYGAGAAVVLLARATRLADQIVEDPPAVPGDAASLPTQDQADNRAIEVRLVVYREGEPAAVTPLTVRAGPEDSDADLLTRAVNEAGRSIREAWKRSSLIDRSADGVVRVQALIEGLADWQSLRGRLVTTAGVETISVISLRKTEVIFDLAFVGSEEQLVRGLAQDNLRLVSTGSSLSSGMGVPVAFRLQRGGLEMPVRDPLVPVSPIGDPQPMLQPGGIPGASDGERDRWR